MRSVDRLLVGLIVIAAALAAPVQATEILGELVSGGARMDGVLVPSGGTILSPATISTEAVPAVIHLANGQLLNLASNSAVYFESLTGGEVRGAIRAGSLVYREASGATVQLASNEVFYANQGSVGSGTPVGQEQKSVRLCELQNTDPEERATCRESPKKNVCEWDPIDVPESEVSMHLGLGDNTPDALDLPQDCHHDVAWPWFAALAPLAKVGVVAGTVGGGIILGNEIQGNDETPATTTQP
jgi:hypothetical protein